MDGWKDRVSGRGGGKKVLASVKLAEVIADMPVSTSGQGDKHDEK